MSTRIAAPKSDMRKAPRQARSRATVEAIVEAAARILSAGGPAGFSTNHVADAAGVGVGSLYQYFPDKHAIVEAIRRRHLDGVLAVLHAAGARQGSLKQGAGLLVDGLVAVHADKPGLHRALLELAPPHADAGQDDFEQSYADAYGRLVLNLQGRMSAARARSMASVLSGAVEGAIHAAARTGQVATPRFRRELVDLIVAYLGPSRPPPTR
jgi:AcrR family transcriptional regulator